jgi:hypothetical protein
MLKSLRNLFKRRALSQYPLILALLVLGCAPSVAEFVPTECTVQQNSSGAKISCPDGTSALIPAGATGAQGNQGSQGAPGINGNTITPVQLCPGTTSYPSTFCEVAFCISGSLWGTYSANDGFSSQLPQGAYSSDGINCSCTVQIGPNCSVSN